jgi:hypothetical protein
MAGDDLDGRLAPGGDGHLLGLGLLGHRYVEGQDAPVEVGADGVGVEALTEEELAAEAALGSLVHHDLVVFLPGEGPLGGDGEGVDRS